METLSTIFNPDFINKNKDALFAISTILIIVAIIVPLPAQLLDLLLTFNITLGVVMLLVSIYNTEPLQFSVFPSLLLITTIFRLALNVSTTRLILLGQGSSMALIKAFGNFVIGGNYIVGIVIFSIIVVIQFMVITKGAERIAEVSARFTLDAMPIKGMAIDADLNSGAIDQETATERRLKLHKEASFFGSMDGASKFVKGDAIAGIIITAINLIAGIAIGVIMRGEPAIEALSAYALFTVGDGLCSQIPALLISVATGIVASRSSSETGLGTEIGEQLFKNSKVMWITSVFMFSLAVIPGLPKFSLLFFGSLFGGFGYISDKDAFKAKAIEQETKEAEEAKESEGPEDVSSLLEIDKLELEIGYNLIPLCDTNQGGDLLNRITLIRRQIALDLGLVVPSIRIRDNIQLPPSTYVFKIKGSEYAKYEVLPDHLLAMITGEVSSNISGIQVQEPAFGLPAIWIQASLRERAENSGYTVVDLSTVIATHLTEVIRGNAAEILGREEMQTLLDKFKENYKQLHDEVIPNIINPPVLLKILQNLLMEGVSIRYLINIMESLADCGGIKDIETLTEIARQGLKRHICKNLVDETETLHVITFDPSLEQMLLSAMQKIDGMMQLALDKNSINLLMSAMKADIEKVMNEGYSPIVICSPSLRRSIKLITEKILPRLVVLSYNEIPNNLKVESVGSISIQQNKA
jgi:flagellar biosynthesis protein FlhA